MNEAFLGAWLQVLTLFFPVFAVAAAPIVSPGDLPGPHTPVPTTVPADAARRLTGVWSGIVPFTAYSDRVTGVFQFEPAGVFGLSLAPKASRVAEGKWTVAGADLRITSPAATRPTTGPFSSADEGLWRLMSSLRVAHIVGFYGDDTVVLSSPWGDGQEHSLHLERIPPFVKGECRNRTIIGEWQERPLGGFYSFRSSGEAVYRSPTGDKPGEWAQPGDQILLRTADNDYRGPSSRPTKDGRYPFEFSLKIVLLERMVMIVRDGQSYHTFVRKTADGPRYRDIPFGTTAPSTRPDTSPAKPLATPVPATPDQIVGDWTIDLGISTVWYRFKRNGAFILRVENAGAGVATGAWRMQANELALAVDASTTDLMPAGAKEKMAVRVAPGMLIMRPTKDGKEEEFLLRRYSPLTKGKHDNPKLPGSWWDWRGRILVFAEDGTAAIARGSTVGLGVWSQKSDEITVQSRNFAPVISTDYGGGGFGGLNETRFRIIALNDNMLVIWWTAPDGTPRSGKFVRIGP